MASKRKLARRIIAAALLATVAFTATACGGPSKPSRYMIVGWTAVSGDVASRMANHCMDPKYAGPYNAYQSTYLKDSGQLTSSGPNKYIHINQTYYIMIDPSHQANQCKWVGSRVGVRIIDGRVINLGKNTRRVMP